MTLFKTCSQNHGMVLNWDAFRIYTVGVNKSSIIRMLEKSDHCKLNKINISAVRSVYSKYQYTIPNLPMILSLRLIFLEF